MDLYLAASEKELQILARYFFALLETQSKRERKDMIALESILTQLAPVS